MKQAWKEGNPHEEVRNTPQTVASSFSKSSFTLSITSSPTS
jgi:hypothetical protein